MYINHNQMAGNVANTLTSHYSNLATSTQRLSSGLRVNSAADDAAGLAIRELMRADISALQQGVRNANDAISLIQTADGALGIIDEKLIRMKELAEQAATGTYDSTQRLMIESEYQAMASEITRIANATDFNGIKLLDGSLEGTHDGSDLKSTGSLKVHFGAGNDSAEDYYYIEIKEMSAAALGVGNASTWEDVQGRGTEAIRKSLVDGIKNADGLTDAQKGQLLGQVETAVENINAAIKNAVSPAGGYELWNAEESTGGWDQGFLEAAKKEAAVQGNSSVMEDFMATGARVEGLSAAIKSAVDGVMAANGLPKSTDTAPAANGALPTTVDTAKLTEINKEINDKVNDLMKNAGIDPAGTAATAIKGAVTTLTGTLATPPADTLAVHTALGDFNTTVGNAMTANLDDEVKFALQNNYDSLREGDKQKLQYAFGKAAMYNLANVDLTAEAASDTATAAYGLNVADSTFGFGNDANGAPIAGADKILADALKAGYAEVADKDVAGFTIETQEDAQHALNALNDAIVEKDKTRAHLGALQNRLENTVSNLTTQAENLQAAESRISDVDVATEMTNFVRNQILTQSAVAMLSQANSMPQMAMQLIG